MKRPVSLIFFLTVVFFSFANLKAQSGKQNVLQECQTLFGKPMDEKLMLFRVNDLFVLQPAFNDENPYQLRVVAKHIFEDEHPEWAEPDELPQIPQNQFRELINKLERIKPKGKLLKKTYSPAVTNSTLWRYELYENALITYGIFEDWRESNREDLGIRWIRINFDQPIRGKVIKKEWSKFYDAYTIVVENRDESEYNRYIVDKKAFGTLRKNAVGAFHGIFADKAMTDFKLSKKKWL